MLSVQLTSEIDPLMNKANDHLVWITSISVWNLVETQIAIAAACAPTLRPILVELWPSESLSRLIQTLKQRSTSTKLSGDVKNTGSPASRSTGGSRVHLYVTKNTTLNPLHIDVSTEVTLAIAVHWIAEETMRSRLLMLGMVRNMSCSPVWTVDLMGLRCGEICTWSRSRKYRSSSLR